jgi:hypothetical protein
MILVSWFDLADGIDKAELYSMLIISHRPTQTHTNYFPCGPAADADTARQAIARETQSFRCAK